MHSVTRNAGPSGLGIVDVYSERVKHDGGARTSLICSWVKKSDMTSVVSRMERKRGVKQQTAEIYWGNLNSLRGGNTLLGRVARTS